MKIEISNATVAPMTAWLKDAGNRVVGMKKVAADSVYARL